VNVRYCDLVWLNTLFLNRDMPRQSNDARPTVAVAARALHFTERDTDGFFRVARLNAEV